MKKRLNNKKGVSPLIATVLLIAFAVALGAIVMNWGRGYVEDTQDFARSSSENQLACSSDVEMDFRIIDVNVTEDDEFLISVRSDGGTDIYDLAVQVFTSTGRGGSVVIDDKFLDPSIDDENVNEAVLPQFRFLSFNVTPVELGLTVDDLEDIDEVKLIPRISPSSIRSGVNNVACPSQSIKIEKLDNEWQYDDQN